MIYGLLADAVVLLHFAFLVFVVFGGVLALRWWRAAWLHLPAAAWGAWVELFQHTCPLTPLENALRTKAGLGPYGGGFIEHYLLPVIYPPGLTPGMQTVLGLLLVAVNGGIYALAWRRHQAHREQDVALQLTATRASRVFALTAVAMTAFAANSLLCRLALRGGHIDPASFTSLRLVSGALVLWLLLGLRGGGVAHSGNWPSATALFVYAIGFSFAYVSLGVGVGALLLFGAVQATMILAGFRGGERPGFAQGAGLALSLAGLVYLMLPGLAAPPLVGAGLMVAAGVAWGVYSLRGRGAGDPARATAGNFILATPLALLANLPFISRLHLEPLGCAYALASGALASGLGYVIWYAALKGLTATRAAIVQLSVPVIAAFGGVLLLDEPVTTRLVIASCVILGGVALAVIGKQVRRL